MRGSVGLNILAPGGVSMPESIVERETLCTNGGARRVWICGRHVIQWGTAMDVMHDAYACLPPLSLENNSIFRKLKIS